MYVAIFIDEAGEVQSEWEDNCYMNLWNRVARLTQDHIDWGIKPEWFCDIVNITEVE